MSRRCSGSEDEDTLLGSKSESLPLQRVEKRRANLTLIHFFLVALLSSAVSIAASLVVWKTVQSKDIRRENVKLLPGLDMPPRKRIGFYFSNFTDENLQLVQFRNPLCPRGYMMIRGQRKGMQPG
jgi:hypothetical protein